jgi:hypothetical protein
LIFKTGKCQHLNCVGFNAKLAGVWGFWTNLENGVASRLEKNWGKQEISIAIKSTRLFRMAQPGAP